MTIPTVPEAVPKKIPDHSAHRPGHKLKLVAAEAKDAGKFTCDGCLRPGERDDARYRCEEEGCEFNLHTCCATPQDVLKHHPAFRGRAFHFLLVLEPERPSTTGTSTAAATGGEGGGGSKGSGAAASCAVCREEVHGFVYHSFDNGDGSIDLHPCCARLSPKGASRNDGVIVFALPELEVSSRRPGKASDDEKDNRGGGTIRRLPDARHRQRVGTQAGQPDPPDPPQNRVFELRRQVASLPGDTSGDRNRNGRTRAPPARHRRLG